MVNAASQAAAEARAKAQKWKARCRQLQQELAAAAAEKAALQVPYHRSLLCSLCSSEGIRMQRF